MVLTIQPKGRRVLVGWAAAGVDGQRAARWSPALCSSRAGMFLIPPEARGGSAGLPLPWTLARAGPSESHPETWVCAGLEGVEAPFPISSVGLV